MLTDIIYRKFLKKSLKAFYNSFFSYLLKKEYAKAVGWYSKNSQYIRFKILN